MGQIVYKKVEYTGSGGSDVQYESELTEGVKIGTLTINGVDNDIKIPGNAEAIFGYENYSEEEHTIGCQIDGKTIYQKTVTITIPTLEEGEVMKSQYYDIGIITNKIIEINMIYNGNDTIHTGNGVIFQGMALVENPIRPSAVKAVYWRTGANAQRLYIENTVPTWGGRDLIVTVKYTKN